MNESIFDILCKREIQNNKRKTGRIKGQHDVIYFHFSINKRAELKNIVTREDNIDKKCKFLSKSVRHKICVSLQHLAVIIFHLCATESIKDFN